MCILFKEIKDEQDFDPSKIYRSTPFTQAFFYGEWQKNMGRKVYRFSISKEDVVVGFFQAVKFPLSFNKSFLYIPYGPVVCCDVDVKLLQEIKVFLKDLAKKEGAIFVRTDFTVPEQYKTEANLFKKVFKTALAHTYHSSQFQPRYEWYLDLHKAEDDILRDMHKNTRYSIRFSEKSEVVTAIVEKNLSEHFDTFYSILKETASRDGFYLHPKAYYENIFKQCDKDANAILALSSHSGKTLAANLIVFYGDTAMFVFGGTSSENRKVMPAYSAQFSTIKYLKEKGYRWYNFGGVSSKEDKHNGWEGLTAFKKRFGGHAVHHDKFYDVVASPFWYFVYNLLKIRKRV